MKYQIKKKTAIFYIGITFLSFLLYNIDHFTLGIETHNEILAHDFQMVEYTGKRGDLRHVNTINIDLPTSNWNISEIDLNFTEIREKNIINEIETVGSSDKSLDKGKNGLAVQMNITEPTTIYSAYIYAEMDIPSITANLTVQIRGYNNITDKPNNTIYGTTLLNISYARNWYIQSFLSPIQLSIGYYYLIINGSELDDQNDPGTYRWYYNDSSLNNPDYTTWTYKSNDWTDKETGKPFLYKLSQQSEKKYYPENINMTAHINGISYNILNNAINGTGNLSIKYLNYSPLENYLNLPITTNTSGIIFNLNYSLSLQNRFFARGSVSISTNSTNTWSITPSITRYYYNYTVGFEMPYNWEEFNVFKNSQNITGTSDVVQIGNYLYILNDSIDNGSNWEITAKSPRITLSSNFPKKVFEPKQKLEFSITPPVSHGNMTFKLIDVFGFEEYIEKKEVTSATTTFSYTFLSNPHKGKWKVCIFWNNKTDAGSLIQEISIKIPFTISPSTLFFIILSIILFSAMSLSSYTTIKKVRKHRHEYRENIYNKYMDILNLNHIIVSEKDSGLNIYSQQFTGKKMDGTLISGFLEAIRSFGIELTASKLQSQTIKLDYKNSKILMSEFKQFRLILIMSETPSLLFLDSINDLSLDIEREFGKYLENFDGELSVFKNIREIIEKHLHVSLINPLRFVKPEKTKIKPNEKMIITRALKSMEEKNMDHFYVATLFSQKGFKVRDAEIIINLLKKQIFQPINL